MLRFISLLFIVLTLTVVLASAQTNCPANLPRYPSLARQARIQGVVQVEFDIAKDGTVINAAAKSGPPILEKGALDTVNTWKFGTRQSVTHDRVEFRYKIGQKDSECAEVRIDLPVVEVTQAGTVHTD
ncbi:MAG: energy transducer TonB [Terriglobales bacterium]|jgi:TonB family protein